MENTNLENQETVENEMTVIPKAYTISEKKNVTMTKETRDLLKTVIASNRETIDLSEYELVGNYLTKQVAVCGTTGLPVRVSLKISYTHNHPNDLSKGKAKTETKSTTNYSVSL